MLALAPLAGRTEDQPERGGRSAEVKFRERAGTLLNEGKYKDAIIELKNAVQAAPDSPEARAALGDAYLATGQAAAAEKELRRALELEPESGAATRSLVESLLLQRRFPEAFELLDKEEAMADLLPEEVALLRGKAYLAKGDYSAAGSAFNQVLATSPNSVPALLGAADVALETKEFDKAEVLIHDALGIDDRSVEAFALLGRLLLAGGQPQKAEQTFSKALEKVAMGARVHGELLWQRAWVRLALDDLDGAEQDLAELKKVSQGTGRNPAVLMAEGRLHLRRGRLQEAQEAFSSVVLLAPDNLPARFHLGAIAVAQGQLEQAVEHLDTVLRAQPDSKEAAMLLAETRLRLRDVAGAEEALQPLIRLDVKDADLFDLMARLRLAQGRAEEGTSYLREAASLKPEAPGLLTRLGLSLLQQNQGDDAIEQLRKSKEQSPDSFVAHAALVGGLIQNKRLDEAVAAAQEMQKRWADRPEPWTFIGIAKGMQRDADAAKQAFEKALEVKPGDASATGNLAAIAVAQGMPDVARGHYERALSVDPGNVEILIKLAKLDEAQGRQKAHAQHLEQALAADPKALLPRILLAKHHVKIDDPGRGLVVLEEVRDANRDNAGYLAALTETQLAAGKVPDAIDTARRLVDLLPEVADAHYLLARGYATEGRYDALREQLLRSFRLSADHPMAGPLVLRFADLAPNQAAVDAVMEELKAMHPGHLVLVDLDAKFARRAGRPGLAVEVYETALKGKPEDRDLTFRLAEARASSGDLAGSAEVLRAWATAHPKDTAARVALANAEMRRGDKVAARAHFEAILDQAPKDVMVLNNLAMLYKDDDRGRALELANKAVGLSRTWSTLDTLGTVLVANGRPAEALAPLREAVRLNPAAPGPRHSLALALARSGDKPGARKVLDELTGPGSDPQVAEQARALLRELGQ